MRSLSPEEAELWARVAATIRPLSQEPAQAVDEPSAVTPRELDVASTAAKPRTRKPMVADKARVGATLDGTWDRRLRSGEVRPDLVLDLHGYSLDAAWGAIDRALEDGISNGHRVVLLITGHARTGDPPVRRGAIRAAVHDWLAASRHARSIAAVRPAHRRHGGGGSLYIVLRRK